MELKHGRIHDTCPDCGGEIIMGQLVSFLPGIASTGFDGGALVFAHASPVCDALKTRHEREWKKLTDEAYESELARQDEAQKKAKQEKDEARARAQRREEALKPASTKQKDR